MEKIDKTISLENYERYIEEMSYFAWEVDDIVKDDKYAYITLKRDPEMENYDRIKELEEQWFSYSYPSMWPTFVCMIIAVGLITALLVMKLVYKSELNTGLWFLYLGLPAFIVFTIGGVWFGYRAHMVQKTFKKQDAERETILNEVKGLVKKDERQDQESQSQEQ